MYMYISTRFLYTNSMADTTVILLCNIYVCRLLLGNQNFEDPYIEAEVTYEVARVGRTPVVMLDIIE